VKIGVMWAVHQAATERQMDIYSAANYAVESSVKPIKR